MEIVAAEDLTAEAADHIGRHLAERLAAGGRVSFASSGGSTPWKVLERFAMADLAWDRVDLYQVDERIVPPDHPDRNLARLAASLADRVPARLFPMPVDDPDLDAAAARYAASLPDEIDLVQLGLGADGHTASLVPGDAALDSTARVAITEPYQGHRRMTLTFPVLDRARRIVWIVAGADKQDAVAKLLAQDQSIPAGRVAQDRALFIADRAALGR